jgi:hypothetical protein
MQRVQELCGMNEFNFEIFDNLWKGNVLVEFPRVSLRGGNAMDSLKKPPDFDRIEDNESDAYLTKNICGLSFLDMDSVRYYVPILARYVHRKYPDDSDNVIEDFLRLISSKSFIDNTIKQEKLALSMLLTDLQKKKYKYKITDIIDTLQVED